MVMGGEVGFVREEDEQVGVFVADLDWGEFFVGEGGLDFSFVGVGPTSWRRNLARGGSTNSWGMEMGCGQWIFITSVQGLNDLSFYRFR